MQETNKFEQTHADTIFQHAPNIHVGRCSVATAHPYRPCPEKTCRPNCIDQGHWRNDKFCNVEPGEAQKVVNRLACAWGNNPTKWSALSFSKLKRIMNLKSKAIGSGRRSTGSTDLTTPEHSGHQVQHWFIALVLTGKKHPSCVSYAHRMTCSVDIEYIYIYAKTTSRSVGTRFSQKRVLCTKKCVQQLYRLTSRWLKLDNHVRIVLEKRQEHVREDRCAEEVPAKVFQFFDLKPTWSFAWHKGYHATCSRGATVVEYADKINLQTLVCNDGKTCRCWFDICQTSNRIILFGKSSEPLNSETQNRSR